MSPKVKNTGVAGLDGVNPSGLPDMGPVSVVPKDTCKYAHPLRVHQTQHIQTAEAIINPMTCRACGCPGYREAD